jgi:hypothetical protein
MRKFREHGGTLRSLPHFSEIANTRLGRFLEERFRPSGRVLRRHLKMLHQA